MLDYNTSYMGAFNNYVDKKRGRGVSQKSTLVHPGGNVHVDQNLTI